MTSLNAKKIKEALLNQRDEEKAKGQERFFKTGSGEYAEGDRFLGIAVPDLHKMSQQFTDSSDSDLSDMLKSLWHEERLLALLILRRGYNKSDNISEKKKKCRFYLTRKDSVNNWDLVDLSAPYILGQENCEGRYLKKQEEMLHSQVMWHRRIAIVSTLAAIRKGRVDDTFRMAEELLKDKEDLMHKATGWMLREAGKIEKTKLYDFLDRFASRMPRTMLRSSLERLPESRKKEYMSQ